MTDIILHHYAGSPFAEKVRVALGIKQAAWKSVDIPNVMPKPDLMPLTGGYRKTPVLQVGADIYCDTQLIMMEIEKRVPAVRPKLGAKPELWLSPGISPLLSKAKTFAYATPAERELARKASLQSGMRGLNLASPLAT